MLKNFEPNKIFVITSKAPKYVLGLFFIIVFIGLIEALILSPEDYLQSHSVRIMYVHVPSAWISLGTFSAITPLFRIGAPPGLILCPSGPQGQHSGAPGTLKMMLSHK